MKIPLSLSRAKSLQPLLVMAVIILMPMFLSSHVIAADVRFPQGIISLVLITIGVLAWRFGSKKTVLKVITTYSILSTIALGYAVLFLVVNLESYGPSQAVLLMKDAAIVWAMIALTFSLWYWLIDSGWAETMGAKDTERADFVFPQQSAELRGWDANWSPSYVEYMSIAFNTNMAFSPADVAPLSHRAKLLMMGQSGLALIIVGTVAARAVGILAT